MVRITIDNARSSVFCDYSLRQDLSDLLSYMIEGAYFAMESRPGWDGRIRLMDGHGNFPTGLVSRVVKYFIKNKIEYEVKDLRRKPKPIETFPTLTLPYEARYYQVNGAAVSDERPRGVYLVGTGGGKSTMAAMVIARRKIQTLVVTPDTGLREQLGEDFKAWFGDKYVDFDVEKSAPIIVSNIQALRRKDPKLFDRFGMMLIDEFHHSSAKSYLDLNLWAGKAYYRYGFTGTFVRPDGDEMTMHGVLSRVIFQKTTSELIEEDFLVRPDIKITRLQLSGYRSMRYKDAYDRLIADPVLNDSIAATAQAKMEEGKLVLILVRRKPHGEMLAEMIPGSVFLSGDHDQETREYYKGKFAKRELKCIIATKIFGEGQNIPTIDALINGRCEKAEIETTQGIGRALRKSEGKTGAEVYDYLIIGHRFLKEHSVERISTYQKEPAFRILVGRS